MILFGEESSSVAFITTTSLPNIVFMKIATVLVDSPSANIGRLSSRSTMVTTAVDFDFNIDVPESDATRITVTEETVS